MCDKLQFEILKKKKIKICWLQTASKCNFRSVIYNALFGWLCAKYVEDFLKNQLLLQLVVAGV